MLALRYLTKSYRLSADGNLRHADASTPESVARELGVDDVQLLEPVTLSGGRRAYARAFSECEPVNPLASRWAGRQVHGVLVVMPS